MQILVNKDRTKVTLTKREIRILLEATAIMSEIGHIARMPLATACAVTSGKVLRFLENGSEPEEPCGCNGECTPEPSAETVG